jgi:steroid delta-isomerase-like uncharacterized protein
MAVMSRLRLIRGRIWMDWNTYSEAWNRHDEEAVAAFFTDDGVYVDHVLGQRHQGKTAVMGFVKWGEAQASSDFRLTLLDHFETADRYTLVWDFSGTHDHSSDDPPLPATGKKFAVRGVSVGRLEDDKIKENTDYWNMVELLSQLGMLPEEPRSVPVSVKSEAG